MNWTETTFNLIMRIAPPELRVIRINWLLRDGVGLADTPFGLYMVGEKKGDRFVPLKDAEKIADKWDSSHLSKPCPDCERENNPRTRVKAWAK